MNELLSNENVSIVNFHVQTRMTLLVVLETGQSRVFMAGGNDADDLIKKALKWVKGVKT